MSKLAVTALFLSPALALAAVPATVAFSARIADNGTPVTGTQSFTFTLFDAATNGNAVWTEPATGTKDLNVDNGVVTTSLGDTVALPAFDGTPLWLEVSMGGTAFAPRIAIQSVPYALRAAVAESMNVPPDCQDVYNTFTLATSGGRCPRQTFCFCVVGYYCPCDHCDSPGCPTGYALTGGGYVGNGFSENFTVLRSWWNGGDWQVRAINNDPSNTLSLSVYARCCRVP